MGFDAHAFEDARTLVLGGVTIPEASGLAGHSDADVVSHALADALLGAAGLGDLGDHFPATPEWKDGSSIDIVRQCVEQLKSSGWAVVNVDVTVVAERPRLASVVPEMVKNLAEAMGVTADAVSVKATTTDGMGFTGRGEGIAALAVALIEPR